MTMRSTTGPAAPQLDGAALDTAIDEARAALAALLRAPGGGEPSRAITEARACSGVLLDRRVALAARAAG